MRDASHRDHPRDRRRDRRLEHPVRGRPGHRRMVVIEMNPRVSRSSALASKATGFPIAKIAAKLAVGYTLDEIPTTSPGHAGLLRADDRLRGGQDPALHLREVPGPTDPDHADEVVGEVMAIGRTFKEALQKALRSRDRARRLRPRARLPAYDRRSSGLLRRAQRSALPGHRHALRAGWDVAEIHEATNRSVVPGQHLRELVDFETNCAGPPAPELLRLRRQAPGLLRSPDRQRGRAHGKRSEVNARRRAGLARSTSWSTPAPPSSRPSRPTTTPPTRNERRGPARVTPQDHDPRRRPQPHRPGHRVRLLLRARGLRAARDRLRVDHGQLATPRPSRPTTTPRTACTSSRSRSRTCWTSCVPREARGHHRAVRRPDAPQPGGAASSAPARR
jgi:hypothetical protein